MITKVHKWEILSEKKSTPSTYIFVQFSKLNSCKKCNGNVKVHAFLTNLKWSLTYNLPGNGNFNKKISSVMISNSVKRRFFIGNLGNNISCTKCYQILRRKITSMLAGLQVPPLVKKWVFNRPGNIGKYA